jgi:hypothetical protein
MPIVDPVTVINTIKPKNGNNFGIVEDVDFIGGFRVVADLTARDAIPVDKMKVGAFVQVQSNTVLYRCTSLSPLTFVPFAGGGGGTPPVVDQFTAIAAQTIFVLSTAPSDPSTLLFFINGARQTYGSDFSVSGSTLTFLAPSFILSAGDQVAAHYSV